MLIHFAFACLLDGTFEAINIETLKDDVEEKKESNETNEEWGREGINVRWSG